VVLRYVLFWFVLAGVAIANGSLRQFAYSPYVSELSAHQISTLSGILLTGAAGWLFSRFQPIESAPQAWVIGTLWLCMTVAFEFGFGHFIAGHSWAKLLADYNFADGRLWLLFLMWITVMPYVLFRLRPQAA
jgi:hypothetical protein